MAKRRKIAVTTAFAAMDPEGRVSPFWIRPQAKDVRVNDWPEAHKRGWRVVKVKVTPIGRPR